MRQRTNLSNCAVGWTNKPTCVRNIQSQLYQEELPMLNAKVRAEVAAAMAEEGAASEGLGTADAGHWARQKLLGLPESEWGEKASPWMLTAARRSW